MPAATWTDPTSQTTNPVIATGDGIAMVYWPPQGRIRDMEFVHFWRKPHQPLIDSPVAENPFLISEAAWVHGASSAPETGSEFMHGANHDDRLVCPPWPPPGYRGRAIDNEMKIRGDEYTISTAATWRKPGSGALPDHLRQVPKRGDRSDEGLHSRGTGLSLHVWRVMTDSRAVLH